MRLIGVNTSLRLSYVKILLVFVFFQTLGNSQQLVSEVPSDIKNSTVTLPVFSETSGFFNEPVALTISHPDADAVIIYTLDGSWPNVDHVGGASYQYKNVYPEMPGDTFGFLLTQNFTSQIYDETLLLEDKNGLPNKLANISSTYHASPNYFPSSPVLKATVVRAKAVVNGQSSKVVTHTYFISNDNSYDFELPVIAISLNENDFFEYNNGIHVAGVDFDNWRVYNPNNTSPEWGDANYKRTGEETEKPANFQYYVNGQLVLSQDIGVRIHGGASRNRPSKTLRLYARASYDEQNSFDYPFFGSQDGSSFKRLILRNSGNDDWSTYFRDALIQTSVKHLSFDTQSYQPAVVFINGEYWGILNIRNRYDKHYFERVYGIEEEDLDYLTASGTVKEGSNSHYLMMRNYITNNNMAVSSLYEYVQTLMDTDNFIDYKVANIYVANADWPGNNIDFFRKSTSEYMPDAPPGQDGRWRWAMFDTDFGFGLFNNNDPSHNTLELATAAGGSSWPNPDWSTRILRNLLENQEFQTQFVTRFADLMNTAFLPYRYNNLIDEMSANIASEIPRQNHRWSRISSVNNWNNRVQLLKSFAAQRANFQRMHIMDKFAIDNTINVQLNVSHHQGGYIHLNTIEIKGTTPGVFQQPYPWNGVYFSAIPINVKAVPYPGAQFSHWSGASSSTNPEITLTSTSNIGLTAHFIPVENPEPQIMFFWVMNNDLPNNTPLEILNATYAYSSNLEDAQIIYESCLVGYPFNPSHPEWRNSSLERRNSPTEINYYPSANYDIPFENVNMRGIQVKQAFQNNGLENILNFNINTSYFEEIKASFAVKDEEAVESLLVEYFDANLGSWSSTQLAESIFFISQDYQLVEIDFSTVDVASNNSNFSFRIRFDGQDLTQNNGDRVTFNNIAIEGTPMPLSVSLPEVANKITIYPNPFNERIHISSTITLEDYYFKLYSSDGRLIKHAQAANGFINTQDLASGLYILQLFSNEGAVETFKLIKR